MKTIFERIRAYEKIILELRNLALNVPELEDEVSVMIEHAEAENAGFKAYLETYKAP